MSPSGRLKAFPSIWFDDGIVPSSGAVRGGVRAAVDALRLAGMVPVAGAPPARVMAIAGWLAYQGDAERRAVAAGFGGGEAWSPLGELGRALRGQPRVASMLLIVEYLRRSSKSRGSYPGRPVSAGSARTKPNFAMFNRLTNASITRHMWSDGISSSKVTGNIVVCSRASPRIYAIKNAPAPARASSHYFSGLPSVS